MRLHNDNLMKLLSSDIEPKISIILPIHPETPQVERNILTYKNLLKDVKQDLDTNYPCKTWSTAVEELESLLLDRVIWNDNEKALLIFANNETMEICEMQHTVLPKQHVGSTFLVQDLLLPEENVQRPDYLINLSRDRINVFDTGSLRETDLEGVYQNFSDYYSDFDANSNVNSRTAGGMTATYHGHRSKPEEQQKDQVIYYQYLDKALAELNRDEKYNFIIAGLPEVLDVYLHKYGSRAYISGVIHGSMLNLSQKQLQESMQEYYRFERVADIERVMSDIEVANRHNRVINDLSLIDFALGNRDVKSLVAFNDGNYYSIEHNKLLLKSMISGINCRVLYDANENSYPSMNAILY